MYTQHSPRVISNNIERDVNSFSHSEYAKRLQRFEFKRRGTSHSTVTEIGITKAEERKKRTHTHPGIGHKASNTSHKPFLGCDLRKNLCRFYDRTGVTDVTLDKGDATGLGYETHNR